jgi:hypothetical protein
MYTGTHQVRDVAFAPEACSSCHMLEVGLCFEADTRRQGKKEQIWVSQTELSGGQMWPSRT